MSVLEEILENLSVYFDSNSNFSDYKGVDYYYDLSHMTANCELPAICYDVGYNDDNSELKSISPLCRSYYREVGMSVHTLTRETDILTGELWDFEESVLKILNTPQNFQDIHPKLMNIKYVGTDPPKSIFHQAFRDDYEEEWVCNLITVRFELEYIL